MSTIDAIRRLQLAGRLEEATKEARRLLPREVAVRPLLGMILAQRGQGDEARSLLEAADGERSRFDPRTLADLGGGFLALEELETAVERLEEAHRDDPDCGVILGRLGAACLKSGHHGKALIHTGKAVQALPRVIPLRTNHARALLATGHPERAWEQLERARDLLPPGQGMPGLEQLAVEVLIHLRRLTEAETHVQRLLDEEPVPSPENRILHTFLLAARNRHREAARLIQQGLEQTPEHAGLLNQAAHLARVQGYYSEAVQYIGRLIAQRPDDPRHWIDLTEAALMRPEPISAEKAARRALELTAGRTGLIRAEALTAMGGVASHQGRFEEAESLFQEAIDLHPDHTPGKLAMGRLCMELGRIDRAVDLFEEVADRRPLLGHNALIQVRRFPDDPAILDDLERAARRPGLEGAVQSGLLFNLAAACENREEYDRAFTCAHQANRAVRPFIQYDADRHSRFVQSLMAAFSRELFAARRARGHPSRLPIFVLGMPRSGTTLVEQILASHSRVHGAGELGVIPAVVQQLAAWERHTGSGRTWPRCIADLQPDTASRLAIRVLEQLRAFAPDARHVVDKLPHNFEQIGLIHLLFPHAAIIHCVRDERDVAVSNYFTNFQARFHGMGYAYDLNDLGRHLLDHRHLMDHWRRVLPGRIHDLSYENLVERPEEEIRRLLDHVGLPWEPGVLAPSRLRRPVKTASLWQVRQPIYTTSKARWRRYAAHLEPLTKMLDERSAPPPIPPTEPEKPSPNGLFLEGMRHMQRQHWQAAESCFRTLLKHHPEHAAGHHFLGGAMYHQGRPRMALNRIRRSIRLHPGHPAWYQNLARVLMALNKTDEARQALDQARDLDGRQRRARSMDIPDPDDPEGFKDHPFERPVPL